MKKPTALDKQLKYDSKYKKQSTNKHAKYNTTEAIEETNSVPYATEMTVSDFGFF